MLRPSSLRILAASLVFLIACGAHDDREAPPPRASGVALPVEIHVAHVDPRLDLPSFVWITSHDHPRFDTAAESAHATLLGLAPRLSLSAEAVSALGRAEIHDLGEGPIVARFTQEVDGVEIFRGGLNLMMNRAYEPVAASGLVVPRLDARRPFTVDGAAAVGVALHRMSGASRAFSASRTEGSYTHFAGDPSLQLARARRVFFPVPGGVVPGWHVELMVRRGGAMSYVVSAEDESILFETSLVKNDAFTYRVYADAQTRLPMDGPQGNDTLPHPTGKPDGYKPTLVPSQLVTLANFPFSKDDPWLPPDAITTSGNNVQAYADLVEPDGLGAAPDVEPALTSPKTFDHLYDTTKSAGAVPASIRASTTHLFYTTNFMHDWFYDSGFDEKSGNHQVANFKRGGKVGADPLLAEAQDYSGRNNANATVPGDGASPRIQMFIYSGPSIGRLTVVTPAALAGDKATGLAGFGKDNFELTAAVVVANDATAPDAKDACESLGPEISGKIALVHRGTCPFILKAQNVQSAGGVGVVIVNVASSSDPNSPPFMGGTDDTVSIPILSLAQADGAALEAAATTGATVRLRRSPQVDLDGALDTSIVAHEWGHVLSGRLVGNGSGLTTNQAGGLGEGWADFVALMLMARADDVLGAAGANFGGVYPKAAYATGGQGSDYYFGIRRMPYSVDFTKNPLTFKHIQNGTQLPTGVPISYGEDGGFNSEVHATGEVWASMLWECYVGLLRDPRLSFAEAQTRMKRYLVAGLKLTPVDPTVIEGRDALLAAALAADEQDFQTFYRAFARRGAGVGAEGPPKDSGNNVGVVESFEVGNDIQIVKAVLTDGVLTCDHDGFVDQGEVGAVEITVRNNGLGALSQGEITLSTKSPEVVFVDDKGAPLKEPKTQIGTLRPFETRTVKANVLVRGQKPDVIVIDVTLNEPTLLKKRVLSATVTARENTDEAASSSSTDGFEAKASAWKGSSAVYNVKWARQKAKEADNTIWHVGNGFFPADHRLQSPSFTIDDRTFSLAFKHRHNFRFSTRRNVFVDGAVVEISTDKGQSWIDLATVSTLAYTATLDGAGDNPLKGRKAFGRKSGGFPTAWLDARADVTLPAHPESILLRFRLGTSAGHSATDGWDIDDVVLTGISSTPFPSFVAHAENCDAAGPTADAGQAQTVFAGAPTKLAGTGAHPTDKPITFVWTQVDGPAVVLRDAFTATPSFDAPAAPATVSFFLRVHDGALVSPASRVDITVQTKPFVEYAVGAGGGCSTGRRGEVPAGLFLGALGLVALRRRSRRV